MLGSVWCCCIVETTYLFLRGCRCALSGWGRPLSDILIMNQWDIKFVFSPIHLTFSEPEWWMFLYVCLDTFYASVLVLSVLLGLIICFSGVLVCIVWVRSSYIWHSHHEPMRHQIWFAPIHLTFPEPEWWMFFCMDTFFFFCISFGINVLYKL